MNELRSKMFELHTQGYKTTEIAKLCETSYQNVLDAKNSIEWAVSHDKWMKAQTLDQQTLFSSYGTFVIEEMVKMIKLRATPPNIKADLLKYLGSRAFDKQGDLVVSKDNKGDTVTKGLTHIDTNTLVDIKGKLKDKE